MKKNIQIALTSIVLVLVSILGLTVMLHGMYSKINAKGVGESRASTNEPSGVSIIHNDYQNFITQSWYCNNSANVSTIYMREMGSNGTLYTSDFNQLVNGSNNGASLNDGKNHFWLAITKNITANVDNYTLPGNKVVHILLNGYSISGTFDVKTDSSSCLKFYDYIPDNNGALAARYPNLVRYFEDLSTRNTQQPTRWYEYQSSTGAYTKYLGYSTNGILQGSYLDGKQDVSREPNFKNNTYIKVKGAVIAPNSGTATAKLEGNIELYGVSIVGNTSPNVANDANGKNGGLINIPSGCTFKSYNSFIIGNDVKNVSAALRLARNSNIEIFWSNIYGNYAATDDNGYGVRTTNIDTKMSDIYGPSNLSSGRLKESTLGVVCRPEANNSGTVTKRGAIYLRNVSLKEKDYQIRNQSIIYPIEQDTSSIINEETIELCDGATYTSYNNQHFNFTIYGSGNTLVVSDSANIGTITEATGALSNTYRIGGQIDKGRNTLTTGGTLQITNSTTTITLKQGNAQPTVYGVGKVIIGNGVSAWVDNGSLNEAEVQAGATLAVRDNRTVTKVSGAGTVDIKTNAVVTNVATSTVQVNGGTAENITGSGTVVINSGRATINEGNRTLSGNTGQVTMKTGVTGTVSEALGATVIVDSGATLNVNNNGNAVDVRGGGAVNIQNGGTATVKAQQTLSGVVTNNGTLFVNGTVDNIKGSGQRTEIGTDGQATIKNGQELRGIVINYGTLNVAGNASNATLTNHKTLNLQQDGSIPSNFTNGNNATLTIASGVNYTITNGLGGTIKNSGTVTITNGTVTKLVNNSGADVKIQGNGSNIEITIDDLTNSGTFTVVSGTYIIPTNKTLSGTVVNQTNGIIELRGDLNANPFTNNGSLRIPRGKTYTIGGPNAPSTLSGKILNSGILNLNGAFTGTLTNESTGEVNLGQNGSFNSNFTNNGILNINDGVTKTIIAPSGNGIIRNQGILTISGDATVENKPVSNGTVKLTITSGDVNTYGTATTIENADRGGVIIVPEGKTLIANTITTIFKMQIYGTVEVTDKIDANDVFELFSGGKIYGRVNIITGYVYAIVIRGSIGDAQHPSSVLNISSSGSEVVVRAEEGANIWNVTATDTATRVNIIHSSAVVNVRNSYNGVIQNNTGTVNLYDGAMVRELISSANADNNGVFIKGNNISITNLNNTGRFTIEQDKIYTVANGKTLNGTVINNGTLNLNEGGTLTQNFTNNTTATFNIGNNVAYNVANTQLQGMINNSGILTIGEANSNSGIAHAANVTNAGTIYLKPHFSNFTKKSFTQGNDGKLIIEANNSIKIWIEANYNNQSISWSGGTIENAGNLRIDASITNCKIKNTNGNFEIFGAITGDIEQFGGDVYVNGGITGNIAQTGGHLYVNSTVNGNVIIGENSIADIYGTIGNEQNSSYTVTNNSSQLKIGTNNGKTGNVYSLKGTGSFTLENGATASIREQNSLTGTNSGNLNLYTSMKSLTNTSGNVNIKGTDVRVNETLSNSGIFTIENAADFTVQESQTLGGTTTINNGGRLTVNGVADDVSGNGTLTINKNADKNGQVTVKSGKTLDGTITNDGVLNIEGTLAATNALTNNGVLNLAENVTYTVLGSMNLGGIINNRGTLIVEGTVDIVTNNNITKSTAAQVTVNGTVNDLSGNSIVTISSNGNVTVVEDKVITGTITNNDGTLTVNGRADDVLGNGTLTINTNGNKIGEVTVKAGNTLSGNVKNNGILNIEGTFNMPNFTNTGTFNLNKDGNIVNPFTNDGIFQIGKDAIYEVREQDNLTNGTVVNNGTLTVGIGKINNLISHGTTDIQTNADINTLVIHDGYTKLFAESIVGSAEVKANGTLEIFDKADLTNLIHNEGGKVIDHRIAPKPSLFNIKGFSWLWLLIIISGILLLILLILILLLIKRKREEAYANEIYDRVEDISLYTKHRDE